MKNSAARICDGALSAFTFALKKTELGSLLQSKKRKKDWPLLSAGCEEVHSLLSRAMSLAMWRPVVGPALVCRATEARGLRLFLADVQKERPTRPATFDQHFATVFGDVVACFLWLPPARGAGAVAAAGLETYALTAKGYLKCFGLHAVREDLGPFTAVAAGAAHVCALNADGQLLCLGCNGFGQCTVPVDLGPVSKRCAEKCSSAKKKQGEDKTRERKSHLQ